VTKFIHRKNPVKTVVPAKLTADAGNGTSLYAIGHARLFGDESIATVVTGGRPWKPQARRNVHIQFVPVQCKKISIAVRSAKRWKRPRTLTASADIPDVEAKYASNVFPMLQGLSNKNKVNSA
jgi:hypothetical protein